MSKYLGWQEFELREPRWVQMGSIDGWLELQIVRGESQDERIGTNNTESRNKTIKKIVRLLVQAVANNTTHKVPRHFVVLVHFEIEFYQILRIFCQNPKVLKDLSIKLIGNVWQHSKYIEYKPFCNSWKVCYQHLPLYWRWVPLEAPLYPGPSFDPLDVRGSVAS